MAQSAPDRIRLIRMPQRVGKPSVLNRLAEQAAGEILIFTDARQRLAADAIERLTENFSDPTIGCVSGELVFTDEESSVRDGISLYWRYEEWLRQQEGQIGSTVGATGALYAIRRRLYRPLEPDTILDDVQIPLAVIQQGYRSVLERSARAYDQVASSGLDEFRRKTRTLAGNYQTFVRFASLLAPGSPIAWQFWSHKLFRTLMPLWLAVAFLTSAALAGPVYSWAWAVQLFFYSLALLGALAQHAPFHKLGLRSARIAYVFCLMNLSAVVGLYRFILARQPVRWEKAHVS